QGDAAETFSVAGDTAQWKSPVDAGSAKAGHTFYVSQGGPMDTNAWFVERLLAQPNRTLDLLPGGQARAEKAASLEVGQGAQRQTVNLWSISGISNSPIFAWADAKDRFFVVTEALAWLPEAYGGERQKVRDA